MGIKLTKNELKAQKDALDRYRRYLPILELRKHHLESELRAARRTLDQMRSERDQLRTSIDEWIGVVELEPGISQWLGESRLSLARGNVAGTAVPQFERLVWDSEAPDLDLFTTSPWVDQALGLLRPLFEQEAKIEVLRIRIEILAHEHFRIRLGEAGRGGDDRRNFLAILGEQRNERRITIRRIGQLVDVGL